MAIFYVFRQADCPDYEGLNYGWDLVMPNGKNIWCNSLREARGYTANNQLHRGFCENDNGLREKLHFDKDFRRSGWRLYWGKLAQQYVDLYSISRKNSYVT